MMLGGCLDVGGLSLISGIKIKGDPKNSVINNILIQYFKNKN